MFRTETDHLGSLDVPDTALWGIHTQRALLNFPLKRTRVPLSLIYALVQVKKACCLANGELGFLSVDMVTAMVQACDEILEGRHDAAFPLDALQGGAGTSTNMNVNEVIANRANQLLGKETGGYAPVCPIGTVNLHQSTNDVYPTAVKVAAIYGVRRLSEALQRLQGCFQTLEKAFSEIPKMGRTEMVDAVPLTLGKEFSAFAEAFARDRWRTFKCEERLRVVNLGGTAIGTGLTAPRKYIFLVIEKLRELTGLGVCRGDNAVDQTANADALVEVSGILDACACNCIKICRDLRLLAMQGEINLPPMQAGSSIMPGKVNPVIAESVIQIGMTVRANHMLVGESAAQGTLQINEFMPLLSHSLLDSIHLLTSGSDMLADYAEKITANESMCRKGLDHSLSIVTALLPVIGYEKAQALQDEYSGSMGEHPSFRAFLEDRFGVEEMAALLSPQKLNALGYR
ncbi:MAG: aspartate ammonia-lyase [Spartobacteria bacterium]|nr:aspartate ammonia-lyase [Spartobacteria bacterium]